MAITLREILPILITEKVLSTPVDNAPPEFHFQGLAATRRLSVRFHSCFLTPAVICIITTDPPTHVTWQPAHYSEPHERSQG